MSEARKILRSAAAHLQGHDTRYFSDLPLLEAIRTLYRVADEVSHPTIPTPEPQMSDKTWYEPGLN